MASRMGGFLRRRVADAVLVIAWLVVLFQVAQIARIEGDSSLRTALSIVAMIAIGCAVTWLWARSRRRSGD